MTYLTHLFEVECPSGQYGLDCSERCSGYCTNNEPCDYVNGICPSGCQDGYIGTHCNNGKIFIRIITFGLDSLGEIIWQRSK